MNLPNSTGLSGICGIDEVGRGPLAGPVTAAAVVLSPEMDPTPLRDSKALNDRQRERLYQQILDAGCAVGVGWVDAAEIDRINIHHASLKAMVRAVAEIRKIAAPTITRYLVDGRFCPDFPEHAPCEAIVGGDHLHPPIMAASIVAKVLRDRWMVAYDEGDDRYGFARHKGYPTAAHKAALAIHGPSPIHRRSFRGVPVERRNTE